MKDPRQTIRSLSIGGQLLLVSFVMLSEVSIPGGWDTKQIERCMHSHTKGRLYIHLVTLLEWVDSYPEQKKNNPFLENETEGGMG